MSAKTSSATQKADESATREIAEHSLFRSGARDRAMLDTLREADRSSAIDFDQKPWGLLYGALINSLGASPSNFQLIYPFTPWTWATQNVGYIGAAQYDFCSAAPQWSAIGMYASSADRVNMAYQEFLNVIPAATDDPVLRDQLRQAADALTTATNGYTTVNNQARQAYADDPEVVDNKPSFTAWLGTLAGRGWSIQLDAAYKKAAQAQLNYDSLVEQANTPGLGDAQKQFANQDFYARLNDPGLSKSPLVPNYQISQSASAWVDAVKAGTGPAGGTMGFTARDQAYDYSKTWAGGAVSIPKLFWEVQVSGKWERINEFESDNELEVSLEFEALDLIQIQPSDWYNGAFVRSKANGPFVRGYSAYGGGGTQAVFGKNGFFNALKTGMYVGYKPNFTIRTSKSTYQSFYEKFKVATGLRIGPFTISAEGGSERAGWTASSQGQTFSGTTTSDAPLILGVSIARVPADDSSERVRADAEPIGDAYTFADGEGDRVARNVTRAEAEALGAHWHSPRAPQLVTPLRKIRVSEEAHPATEVLNAPDADMQTFPGGNFAISVLPPLNLSNGGPDTAKLYRLRAVNALTSQPVDLRYLRFLGISHITGAARFTDQ